MGAFVGRGLAWSVDALAAETGIAVSTLRDYLAGHATPGLPNLLKLLTALPSEFADMVLMPAGLGGCRRLAMGEAGPLTLNAKASELVAMIGLHLEDGRIDHVEEAQQVPLVRRLRAACDRFLAGRDGERSGPRAVAASDAFPFRDHSTLAATASEEAAVNADEQDGRRTELPPATRLRVQKIEEHLRDVTTASVRRRLEAERNDLLMWGRAAAARRFHTPEVAGSNPAPATSSPHKENPAVPGGAS